MLVHVLYVQKSVRSHQLSNNTRQVDHLREHGVSDGQLDSINDDLQEIERKILILRTFVGQFSL